MSQTEIFEKRKFSTNKSIHTLLDDQLPIQEAALLVILIEGNILGQKKILALSIFEWRLKSFKFYKFVQFLKHLKQINF